MHGVVYDTVPYESGQEAGQQHCWEADMAIGQKMGSLKTLKKSLSKGTGQNAWIKYIPKNGSMNVRFIQEPEEWVNYVEHYDQTVRKSYPCSGEASCPGCTTGERKSNRYLANAVDVDNDRVIPLQMPKDLANRLVVRYERNGTLTDRDFELSRSGEGLDTVYDLDAGPADRKKIDKYTPLDLLKVLQDAYDDVFGGGSTDDDDDDVPATPGPVKTRKRSAAIRHVEEHDVEVDDEDEDDEEPVKPAKKTAAKKAAKKAVPAEPVFTPDDSDEDEEDVDDEPDVDVDDDSEEDEEGEEGEVYDEETLKALPLGALRAVARDFGVVVKGKTADQIVAEILASGEEVDDEDEEAIPF